MVTIYRYLHTYTITKRQDVSIDSECSASQKQHEHISDGEFSASKSPSLWRVGKEKLQNCVGCLLSFHPSIYW